MKIVDKMKVYRKTVRVARVEEMEARFDRVKAALDEVVEAGEVAEAGDAARAGEVVEAGDAVEAVDRLASLRDDIETLREYLGSGKWQKDFEADEQGKLPESLKRGVLSEDGLWNLLEEVDERIYH